MDFVTQFSCDSRHVSDTASVVADALFRVDAISNQQHVIDLETSAADVSVGDISENASLTLTKFPLATLFD